MYKRNCSGKMTSEKMMSIALCQTWVCPIADGHKFKPFLVTNIWLKTKRKISKKKKKINKETLQKKISLDACNAGDPGSISGLGRSPGEGKGYQLQYSGLENFIAVHGVAKSNTVEGLSLFSRSCKLLWVT